ncbi:hypothetical protein OW763_08535 [Clostridium aestuarii]|uniref:Uncharacterized protein n=2 Tax=Clostridium aestuarii TaxID=338193 RepID=A0ABT4D2Y5_9CLOT|nr:hypothetical protein [Clostridium aestuarii]
MNLKNKTLSLIGILVFSLSFSYKIFISKQKYIAELDKISFEIENEISKKSKKITSIEKDITSLQTKLKLLENQTTTLKEKNKHYKSQLNI